MFFFSKKLITMHSTKLMQGDVLNERLGQLLKRLAAKQTPRYLSERRDTERERDQDDDRSEDDSEEDRDHFDRHSLNSHSRSQCSDREVKLPPPPQPLYEALFPELFVY